MPFIAGPIGVLLVAGVLLLALVVWLLRERKYPGPRLHGDAGIDREELEEAEREVRELDPPPPDDDRLGDDWGPGAARPRPPVRL
ncbi:MAG TPA: hypothetical protein VFZ26_19120 [Gemmatimonadales bacterium]